MGARRLRPGAGQGRYVGRHEAPGGGSDIGLVRAESATVFHVRTPGEGGGGENRIVADVMQFD